MDYYELFCLWCASIGKKPSTVAQEVGLTKGAPTNWKNRHSVPPIASQIAISSYFGVTIDGFKDGPNKKAPAESGEREPTKRQIRAAFFNGIDENLSEEEQDELWEDAQDVFRVMIAQRKRRNGEH